MPHSCYLCWKVCHWGSKPLVQFRKLPTMWDNNNIQCCSIFSQESHCRRNTGELSIWVGTALKCVYSWARMALSSLDCYLNSSYGSECVILCESCWHRGKNKEEERHQDSCHCGLRLPVLWTALPWIKAPGKRWAAWAEPEQNWRIVEQYNF